MRNIPKNIAILSPAHPLRGGIAASTERLAQELQQYGAMVTIFSFSLQYPSLLFPGKTQYTDDPKPEGLHIRTMVNSINPLNWWKMGKLLQKEKFDLVIVRYWLPFLAPCKGSILRLARKTKSTKVIAITDNVIPHERRPGDRLFTGYFINSVDGCIVMSRSVEKDIWSFDEQKPVKYVPHPVYDNYGPLVPRAKALEYLKLSDEYKYLLFFGFIRDYKGLDLLLEALSDERLKKLKIKLIVAGEYYGNRDYYEDIIRAHQLEDKLILHNEYIPLEDVKYFFGAASLIAQPYKSATQSGISQLAYHFEKPMLVTAVGGLPEIIEHGKAGYVVDVSTQQIADSILDFFQKDRETFFSEGVKENKKLFSWKNMVKGIVDLYNDVLMC